MRNSIDKQKILRYAALILKKQTYEIRHLSWTTFMKPEEQAEMEALLKELELTPEEIQAINAVPKELGITPEKILELASKNLNLGDDGC